MVAAVKLAGQMRQNPRDWRIEDVETVAAHFGFRTRRPGGRHVTFSHPQLRHILTVPANRPVKPVYIRKLLALIEQLEEWR